MNVYDYSNINKCVVCGSVDGKIDKLIKWIINRVSNLDNYQEIIHPKEGEQHKNKRRSSLSKSELNNSLLIVNGSNCFGSKDLKYYYDRFKSFDKVLEDNNCKLVFVRGSDDPKYFEDGLIDFDNIKTIRDFSVIKLEKYNCLCIGGSISPDRKWKKQQEQRIGKKLYWEEERMNYDEEKLIEILDEYEIGCVVTPDSPSFIAPSTNNLRQNSIWFREDELLMKDISEERNIIDKIYIKMIEKGKKPYMWFHSKFTKQEPRTIVNDILFHAVYPFQGVDFARSVSNMLGIDVLGKITSLSSDGLLNVSSATWDMSGTWRNDDHDEDNIDWDEEEEIFGEDEDEDRLGHIEEVPPHPRYEMENVRIDQRNAIVNDMFQRFHEQRIGEPHINEEAPITFETIARAQDLARVNVRDIEARLDTIIAQDRGIEDNVYDAPF